MKMIVSCLKDYTVFCTLYLYKKKTRNSLPFEVAATMKLKGGYPIVKIGGFVRRGGGSGVERPARILRHRAFRDEQAAGRTRLCRTDTDFPDYFLARVNKFVAHHPLIEEYKALRLKDLMPSLREIQCPYSIGEKLEEIREAATT